MLGMKISEALEICVKEYGMKMPLQTVTIDMGGHIVACTIHEDGRIVPLVDPGRGVTAPLYPVHTLVVDCDGNSMTLTASIEDEPMRTIH